MSKEINAGYEIIASEIYEAEPDDTIRAIVLGERKCADGMKYVTWERVKFPGENEYRYAYGHYFVNEPRKARADYHTRLAEKLSW